VNRKAAYIIIALTLAAIATTAYAITNWNVSYYGSINVTISNGLTVTYMNGTALQYLNFSIPQLGTNSINLKVANNLNSQINFSLTMPSESTNQTVKAINA